MDFYLLLGLERTASLGDIKRAYRRLARRYHPDVNPGDQMAANQFRRILEAYETLVDPDRRRRYDVSGVVAVATEASAFGFEGFDFSMSVEGTSASTFGDLFGELLRQRDRRADDGSPVRGADLHQTVTLAFDESLQGTRREITVTRLQPCRVCAGTGRVQSAESRCGSCQGHGVIKSARGHMVFSKPCGLCSGTGRQAQTRCGACGGHQTHLQTDVLTVNLRPGLADGARIRVPGRGHAGANGGDAGDLYVNVRVEPHPRFRREGDDLHVTVPVAIHEAALGARVDIPSIDGAAQLRVPPGTQSGQRFRIRGRGAPSTRDGNRGDLVVEVRLVLPDVLDQRSRDLLKEFGQINAGDVRKGLTS